MAIVTHDQRRYLVAPYGAVAWVHNARAAGYVKLTRGTRSEDYSIRELDAREAAPVLKRYVSEVSVVGPYFHAAKNAPIEELEREAHLHPVFAPTRRQPTEVTGSP